jgi:hypothetical protein
MGSFWHYKAKGFYASQVRDYLAAFSTHQVKIYLFEDLKNDAASVCRELFSFLGVDPYHPDTSILHNVSGVARIAALQRALNRPSGLLKLGYLLPAGLRKKARAAVRKINIQNDRKLWPQLEKNDAAYLLDIYRSDILELQEVIGKDLTPWLRKELLVSSAS